MLLSNYNTYCHTKYTALGPIQLFLPKILYIRNVKKLFNQQLYQGKLIEEDFQV